jgi:hypothetical protein
MNQRSHECPIHIEISNQMKYAVIQAASRGRNAVRMAMLRAQEIRNSDEISSVTVHHT